MPTDMNPFVTLSVDEDEDTEMYEPIATPSAPMVVAAKGTQCSGPPPPRTRKGNKLTVVLTPIKAKAPQTRDQDPHGPHEEVSLSSEGDTQRQEALATNIQRPQEIPRQTDGEKGRDRDTKETPGNPKAN
ncbi:unnamed protein product [Calypogeia fissa]